jgi:hypothetical protein
MKRSVHITIVLLVASVGFIAAFAASGQQIAQVPRPRLPESPPVDQRNLYEDTASTPVPTYIRPQTEPNQVADPNKVRAKVKSFAGLEKTLADLDRQSQIEIREWLQVTTDNRINQVRAVERQVKAELDAIRKIAVEEKAAKTVAAIDGLELNRLERMRKLLRRMQEEAKGIRQTRGVRGRTPYGSTELRQSQPQEGYGGETVPPQDTTGQQQYREEDARIKDRLRRR